jgi:hypothetical protein
MTTARRVCRYCHQPGVLVQGTRRIGALVIRAVWCTHCGKHYRIREPITPRPVDCVQTGQKIGGPSR